MGSGGKSVDQRDRDLAGRRRWCGATGRSGQRCARSESSAHHLGDRHRDVAKPAARRPHCVDRGRGAKDAPHRAVARVLVEPAGGRRRRRSNHEAGEVVDIVAAREDTRGIEDQVSPCLRRVLGEAGERVELTVSANGSSRSLCPAPTRRARSPDARGMRRALRSATTARVIAERHTTSSRRSNRRSGWDSARHGGASNGGV